MKFFVFIDDLSTLPQVESFVNHFFDFFKFKILKNQKRRRRDLNPRAAINDLLPFQGSPFGLLGTSPSNPTVSYNIYAHPLIC